MYKTPIHILLVEDSPSDANLLRQMLLRSEAEGWELVHVERLFDAIDACSDRNFDVVLLDLSLPDSDGLETVDEFRAAAPDIPIVVLTGVDDEDLALSALHQGAQDYLVKGQINYQLLLKAIRYAIERATTQEQLRQSEERYRQLVELCPDAILIYTQGRLVFVNSAAIKLLGANTPDELIGTDILDYVHPDYREIAQERMHQVSETNTVGSLLEEKILKLDGTVVDIEVAAAHFTYEQQSAVQVVIRDISDRKLAEAKILQALEKERELNQLKSRFVSMVSHEFRNPMTTIMSAADLLENYNHQLTEDRKSKYFALIQTSISNMVHLLDEVLLLGKTEAGRFKYQPVPLDLERFCRELTETVRLNASNQHKITFTSLGQCPIVEMDENLLRHILTNLLSNAIKYSPEGGNIRFDLIYQDGTATFRVQDEGIGIPLKDQERLFETFHRGSNVSGIEGTGLGLALVKNCIDLHGGQIQVESEVGVGTTFTVTLPLQRSQS